MIDRSVKSPTALLHPEDGTGTGTAPAKGASGDSTTFRGIVQGDGDLTFQWCALLVDSLVAAGVTDAVMCPGAQMAPLALACRANQALTVNVFIDERAAGFFALGLSRVTLRPTLLICTSGSAVGEFFPCVMEASTGLVPLIIVTADRAPENQDRCSAQAIDQTRVFGEHVNAFHGLPVPDHSIDTLPALASRVYEQALWPKAGPVHLNQPLRDPLVPTSRRRRPLAAPPVASDAMIHLRADQVTRIADTLAGRRGVIVCGATENPTEPGFAAAVYELSRQLGCPIIADPFSNLRFGAPPEAAVIARADTVLRATQFTNRFAAEWVLNFGGPPLSKPVLTYMHQSRATDHIVVEPTTRWSDPLVIATELVRSSPELLARGLVESGRLRPAEPMWAQSFRTCDDYIDRLSATAFETMLWEAPIIRRLIRAAPDGAAVFSGNSMAVRDFDSFSGTTATSLRLLANRGTNGIDGSIGTLTGVAAAQPHLKTVALIGDMAFSHDVGSLQLARGRNILLVVNNNAGGGIFSYLPMAKIEESADFFCPPSIDICAAARACGWTAWRATDLPGFDAALAEGMATEGPCLIEAVVDREASVQQHKLFWSAVEGINAVLRLRGPEGLLSVFGGAVPPAEVQAEAIAAFVPPQD